MTVTVSGVDSVAAHLNGVLSALAAPQGAHAAAAAVVAAAARAPVRTGALAASIRPFPGEGARVGSDLPYAPLVEHRTHFLAKAVTASQPQWLPLYQQAAADATGGA